MAAVDFDVLVIGGGSAGYAAARVAGGMGARVGLVERGPVGGLCILDGCMPSKALLRSAAVLHLLHAAGALGVRAPAARLDFGHVMARKRRLVDAFAADRRREIAGAAGVTLLLGEARLCGPREVALRPTMGEGTQSAQGTPAARVLRARKLVLATGSSAWVPPVPGLAEAGYLTSDTALSLEAPPESLVVLGAGATALELGQFYARAGTKVTLVEHGARLLGDEDAEVGRELGDALRAEGLEIHIGATVLGCRRGGPGERVAEVEVEVGGRRREVRGAALLVATGRRAAVGGLDLARGRVALDPAGQVVAVNGALRTSNRDVFAAGDVASRRQMTHLAVLQGEVAGFNAARDLGLTPAGGLDAYLPPAARRLGGVARAAPHGRLRMDYAVVPQVIFTDPPFARVGLSEEEARAAGQAYRAARCAYAGHGAAEVLGHRRGFVKMVAARRGGRLLGVQILGHQAETLIHAAVLALAFGATAAQVARLPHYHPTLSELLGQTAADLAGNGSDPRPQ